jgi:hypothetical protein
MKTFFACCKVFLNTFVINNCKETLLFIKTKAYLFLFVQIGHQKLAHVYVRGFCMYTRTGSHDFAIANPEICVRIAVVRCVA